MQLETAHRVADNTDSTKSKCTFAFWRCVERQFGKRKFSRSFHFSCCYKSESSRVNFITFYSVSVAGTFAETELFERFANQPRKCRKANESPV